MTTQVIVNGGSGSGKTVIARCLQAILPRPWISLGVDDLLASLPPSLTDSAGQVYTALQPLQREASSPPTTPAPRPPEGLPDTDSGLRELAGWLRTRPDVSSPPRNELVMKVLAALGVPRTDVAELIRAHRRYLVKLMQQRTRSRRPRPTSP